MSMLLMPTTTSFGVAPLKQTISRSSIYDLAPMSGENIHRRQMLPVDNYDSYSDELEAAYASNMKSYFGEMPTETKPQNAPLTREQKAMNEALLLLAHSKHSIYDTMSLPGENCSAQCVLPINHQAEQNDICSDTMDHEYATAMAKYFATETFSRM
ncbi:hypothetical protein PHYBOEH_011463 [Phytophthora boehmeriae]|uniref:Uncharacterized protein n=1 Tax=Phytophthora boehmeriae TaxID=109152 RepID=A0A8T1X159_9STRA|nr:hypothetical protein PHYBOEH_011463 [Phytophthora boehmeriae]